MINAIINNKVDRQYFRANEDSLTSFVFEKLSYLPNELFEHILINSINDAIPKFEFKSLKEITYWPHWSSKIPQIVNLLNLTYLFDLKSMTL